MLSRSPPPAVQQPKRRDFSPVPFKIVADPLPTDRYRSSLSGRNRAHYKDMLIALAGSKRGSVACLESVKPLAQIKKAAVKLGYEVHFAEDGGKLYVQILSTGADN